MSGGEPFRAMATAPVVSPARERAPMIGAVGFFMLLAVFLMANPAIGSRSRSWPWQLYGRLGEHQVRAVLLLWVLTALVALVGSLFLRQRLRSALLLPLAVVLVAWCCTRWGGFTVETFTIHEMLVLSLIGGGFALAASTPVASQGNPNPALGLARGLLATGSLCLFWILVIQPDPDVGRTRMYGFWRDWEAVALGGTPRPAHPLYLWWTLVPRTLILLGGVLGLLLAILGRRPRLLGTLGVACVALALASPLVVSARAGLTPDLAGVAQAAANTFVGHGLLLWWLGAAAIADACGAARAGDLPPGGLRPTIDLSQAGGR